MKTKFTKVAVEERLPTKSGEYICFSNKTDKAKILTFSTTDSFDTWYFNQHVNYWLEEIPDREEEMIEMLERIQDLDVLPIEIEDELSTLLQSLKQEK